ncbi:YdcF family protein [Balnearium lithotrophicum]|uniref:YdcF family protein n=1 Tax=Balnearium lithotrophicum TaxID=223788 RepID=UPI003CCC5996
MKRFLVELGIPEDKIIEEKKSRNTLENALFTREILETKGIDKICLVTLFLKKKWNA